MEETLKQNQQNDEMDVQRPFLGLRSYEEVNKTQFGGRDNEIKELFNLTETNRLSIVFGKSGIGKTSLVKAGLIPQLQNNYYFPVYLRIDYSSVKTPLNQAKTTIYEKLKQRDDAVPEFGKQTLWEYFSNLRLLDGLLTPVLIIDQFEEIFTIGKEKSTEVQEFLIELSDLAENRVPMQVQKKYHHKSEMPDWNYDERNIRVIISLREDYLANLQSFKRYLPSIKNSLFRVLQMTAIQAMDAVMKPARHLIDKVAATAIIKKLPGITDLDFEASTSEQIDNKKYLVEPFLLSLICFEINEKRIESGMEKITPELVSQFEIADVINGYYNKTMQTFSENVKWGIEDSLLTESGFRKLQSLEELEKVYYIKDSYIQQLIEKRIIRKEHRDGVEYVELIHDVLTPVIKQSRDIRKTERTEKEKREAIEKAIELDRSKIKKTARAVGLFIILPLVLILLGIITYRLISSERRYKQIAFAEQLLKTASNILNVYGKDTTAALISRTAYLINAENDGGDAFDFYNSMYYSMKNIGNFTAAYIDNTSITAMLNDGDDVFYFACDNGEIYKKNGIDSTAELISNFDSARITSLAISPDKKYLAARGFLNDVRIIDLSAEQYNFEDLATGDNSVNGEMSVSFTASGRLIVRLDSGIIGWERKLNTWSPILWNQKIYVETAGKTKKKAAGFSSLPNNKYFKYSEKGFKCMAVYKETIAIGLDSGLILLTRDSVINIQSTEMYSPTAVAFDPSGKFLFIGDDEGNMHRVLLSDFSTESSFAQYTEIKGITFTGNGQYMATVSIYGIIAIWNMETEFNAESALVIRPQYDISDTEDKAIVKCLAACLKSDYILAGYSTGAIYKWPVSLKMLSQLICSCTNNTLDTLVLKKVLKNDFDIKKLEKYNCKNNHGN